MAERTPMKAPQIAASDIKMSGIVQGKVKINNATKSILNPFQAVRLFVPECSQDVLFLSFE